MSRISLLFLLFVYAPIMLMAQHSYTPADIAEGGRLFRANCVLCHGPEGDQVPGIDLGHAKFRQTYSEEALIKIIQNGIPDTAMPPHNLQDFQAGTIVAYLRTMATAGRTVSGNGNPTRGKLCSKAKVAAAAAIAWAPPDRARDRTSATLDPSGAPSKSNNPCSIRTPKSFRKIAPIG